MSYRRRHRWFRRQALGLALASMIFASVAAAKPAQDTNGSRYVAAGGWSGLVDMESGVPLAAGIPNGDEQLIVTQAIHDPYPTFVHVDGDAIALANAIQSQQLTAEAIHDPQPTSARENVLTSDELAFATAVVAAAGSLHDPLTSEELTSVAFRPDDRADRFVTSDVASQPELASSSGTTIEWDEALMVGIGALVLVLGLGLAIGYLRRPRLAGL